MTDEMIAIILVLLLTWFVFYRSKILGLRMIAGIIVCVVGFYSLTVVSTGIAIMLIMLGAFIVLHEGYNAVVDMSRYR